MDDQERFNRQLPPPGAVALRDPYAQPSPYNAGWEPEAEEPGVPLAHYLWILRRYKWRIIGFIAACVFATFIVSSRLAPIYESTVVLDVDRQSPMNVVGDESSLLQANSRDSDQFLATQVRIIQSDSVLRPVVEKYDLEVADRSEQQNSPLAEDAPIRLEDLKVVRPPNTYLLLISYRSQDPQLAADVANAIAHSYIEHTYNIRINSTARLGNFMEKQIEELRAKMERSGAALAAFERELNVINPEEKTSILSARLLDLNSELTKAQTDRVKKEAAFEAIDTGTIEAAMVSSQGETLKRLIEQKNEAEQTFAAVKAQYGANHPAYKKALVQLSEIQRIVDRTNNEIRERVEVEYQQSLKREAMLQSEVQKTKQEFDRLNLRSFEYQNLKREADGDKALYEELVRKIREAGINSNFQNNPIRVADPARPGLKPVFPRTNLNLVLAFLFSTLIAVGAAVLSDVLDSTVRDPEQIQRSLKTEILGTLPAVKKWKGQLIAPTGSNGDGGQNSALVLAEGEGNDRVFSNYEEAIRTLRNSILLSDFDRRLRSIMLTSASPAEGKSTTAAHLAVAHAEQGRKTLIVDGDLRRPSLHRLFGLNNAQGLSNIVLTGGDWREAVLATEDLPSLHVLPAGVASRRAADFVGAGLMRVLDEAQGEYDLIIVDTPPVLGFAEPLQVATCVDGVVLVTRAGQTNRKALGTAVSTLNRLRVNLLGIILNDVTKEMSTYYYYYSYYGKYYGKSYGGADQR